MSLVLDSQWEAVVGRDSAADGQFVYAVRTTGVYCRPSCAARTPCRENVEFHPTSEAAARAGFRPCRRCRPDEAPLRERQAALIATACRQIEAADEPLPLETLAGSAGLSPHHFHRVFRATTGVTPKAYADAHRAKRLREGLASGEATVSQAMVEAGFNSSGRFYAASDAMLGMAPKTYQKGGPDARIQFAVGQSSLGAVLVARSERGVCAILLGDDPDALVRDLQDRFPNADLVGGEPDFEKLVARVVGFVEAPAQGLDLPLDVRGTAFQRRVWEALQAIPAGRTASYADVARTLGEPGAVRAVAGACAANSLAVAIPCHRVVRSDGALSGYRWGVDRKRELLRREAASD